MHRHFTIGSADHNSESPFASNSAPNAEIGSPGGGEPDGAAWHTRAEALAQWAMTRLVNRTDRCVRYLATPDGVRPSADPPRPEDACEGFVDLARLQRHFRATGTAGVIALYSYGPGKTGKWCGIDIDNHDGKSDPEANRRYAIRLYTTLTTLGFHPLVYESNGDGGFHVWVLFATTVSAETLHRFGLWLTRDHAEHDVPAVEVFPKNAGETPWGSALRVPGRHHRRGVWPKVWNGIAWVNGDAAIDQILSLSGDDPKMIPPDAAFHGVEPATGATTGHGDGPEGPWEVYNRTITLEEVAALLERHGWSRGRERSDGAIGFVRPGKDVKEGEGGNLLAVDGMPVFHCFTDSAPPLKPGSYAPAALLAYLEHGGDFAACNRDLAARGFRAEGTAGSSVAVDNATLTITAGISMTVTAAGKPGRHLVVVSRDGGPQLHRDALDLDSATSRARFITGVMRAAYPGVADDDWPSEVRAALDKRLLEVAAAPPAAPAQPSSELDDLDPRLDELVRMPADIRADAEAMLQDPQLLDRIAADIETAGVVGERELALTIYLAGVSTQLPKPLAVIVRGASTSGKSFIVERIASLFPPEIVLKATSLTTNALYYFPPGQLRHRWVVAGERSRLENDDRAEATRAMREMIEAGRLTKAVPMKENDRIVTRVIEQEGPIGFIETTTLANVFEEDANRCLLLATDEREEQTRRILAATASLAAGRSCSDLDRTRAIHHAIQRMLPRREVTIPFAHHIAALFPSDRLDARRLFRHLLGLVKASALLHHRQRKNDSAGNVAADLRDYQIAANLGAGPLAVARGGLGAATRRFLDALRTRFPRTGFDTNEAASASGGSRSSVRAKLIELDAAGLISQRQPAHGNVPAEWVLGIEPSDTGGLPTVDQIRERLAIEVGQPIES